MSWAAVEGRRPATRGVFVRGLPRLSRRAVLRRAVLAAADAAVLLASLWLAYWLRYDGRAAAALQAAGPSMIVTLDLFVKLGAFGALGLYALSVSQMGMEDVGTILRAVAGGTAGFAAAMWVAGRATGGPIPGALLAIDGVLTLCGILGPRLALRVWAARRESVPAPGTAALIVGAGVAGEQLASSLRTSPGSGYVPIGFLDDDAAKHGSVIHGLRVLGPLQRLGEVVRAHNVEAVLIAMPSASSQAIRRVVAVANDAGIRRIRIIPGLERILQGQASFTDLQQVQLDDLLGRRVVTIDSALVGGWLRNRRVLVTGAAGSIGSELCRQIARFRPEVLVPVDYDETGLFWVARELERIGQPAVPVIGDVRDGLQMRDLFRRLHPDVVFHAAAYKHVGLMEQHPLQSVHTNVLGTLAAGAAARDAAVERFVLISTDKAVNPASMMGVTKRVAEQVCLAMNAQGPTRYTVVRFGNVLGSRGSVIPLFQEQIRRGEPLTVRGANTQRYFMVTSEAVLLVLQAGAMGQGGEVFVLDMGQPIRILDLAQELIRLSGLRPHADVPIIVADPLPGEKEVEDLMTAEDGTVITPHRQIHVARRTPLADPDRLLAAVASLEPLIKAGRAAETVRAIKALVPTYRPSDFVLAEARQFDSAAAERPAAVGV
ncbi:MAG TPA: nucleoside-diphosphate sugar epimerase/dehydratase [bacterium]|nr:nucleoside-diphosphate sugar epimerase/dehydratase [bacterium]